MRRPKILFIGGSLNQTSMMHKISIELKDYDNYFTPFYCDGWYSPLARAGLLDFTIIGGQNRENTERYFRQHQLPVDYKGDGDDYDLVVTCTDLLVQKNIRNKKKILVQEGMTDPENAMFQVVRSLRKIGLPLWLASTSTTGLSDQYDVFCVASDGYREHFIKKGVNPKKIAVTGIPNFDNLEEYAQNDFPYHGYVLVATSDTRENYKWDNRNKFIKRAYELAGGREMIVKLHPNENMSRSTAEIKKIIPEALVLSSGNSAHMVANCSALITQYSTLVYIGIGLGKEVYSYFDVEELKRMVPIQNAGKSAANIAEVCRRHL